MHDFNLYKKILERREIEYSEGIIEIMNNVKNIVVVLTAPRSWSSLFSEVLSQNKSIISMNGEINPFLSFTYNSFCGYASGEDLNMMGERLKWNLLCEIYAELGVSSEELSNLNRIKELWKRRLLIQFPERFFQDDNYNKMLEYLDVALKKIWDENIQNEIEIHKIILSSVFSENPELLSFYDIFSKNELVPPIPSIFIEEPPFVCPNLYMRPLKAGDFSEKTIYFKSPEDARRISTYKYLFPNAEIKYIHLTRGFAQTINGLIDGWLSPKGFFTHNMKDEKSTTLNIKGYSDALNFGKEWWKFDLLPNWQYFINDSLINVCAEQWISNHKAILDSGVPNLRIHFEDFISNPQEILYLVSEYLKLEKNQILGDNLPIVMSTDTPQQFRWKKRENEILEIWNRDDIMQIMNDLGYTMDHKKWL